MARLKQDNPSSQASRNDAPFEEDVARILKRLRSELSEVIAAVPSDVRKGADLMRALRIDKKLSWRIFKVANAPDPIAAGPHVPSRANLSTFFKAAAREGVPAELVETASRTAFEFQKVVSAHADDRTAFDSMVSALGDRAAAEQIDLTHRRLAFRGLRHIYGVQARTQLKFAAIQPAAELHLVDFVRIEGLIDLRQLRGNAPLVISRAAVQNDDGSPREIVREPLDPMPGSQRLSLLREFCSRPLPKYREVDIAPGGVDTELVSKGVGKRAAITCIEGHVVRAAFPRYREKLNLECGNTTRVLTPCEVLVIDLLMHEDTYETLAPNARVCSERLGPAPALDFIQERDLLPMFASVTYLGKGPSVLHTPDVPRYAQLGQYVFDRLGWDGERFDVYRCRIEYPVVPSEVMIRFDLPEAPGE